MNLLLFSDADRSGPERIVLRDQRLGHLLDVHGASAGDTLRVGEVDGLVGKGRILRIDTAEAELQVHLDQSPPEKLPLVLVLALPRPKMLRRILRAVAEFGVPELHLINSYRVEKSFWNTPALEADTVRDYLLQGLQQARDTRLPTVHCHRGFKPFVEDTLPGLLESRTGLVAHPGNHPPCPRPAAGPTLLVIGPEGGFIPYEVEKLQAAACATVSLGARILRVENAILAALGRLF
jgi:RsmE family RNA methyltransferase